uniref:Uncharacterized protein n=1 Tax=Arundo donax TaxID=35708 RepID=A0A0A9ARR2_ARUDO
MSSRNIVSLVVIQKKYLKASLELACLHVVEIALKRSRCQMQSCISGKARKTRARLWKLQMFPNARSGVTVDKKLLKFPNSRYV